MAQDDKLNSTVIAKPSLVAGRAFVRKFHHRIDKLGDYRHIMDLNIAIYPIMWMPSDAVLPLIIWMLFFLFDGDGETPSLCPWRYPEHHYHVDVLNNMLMVIPSKAC